MQKELGKEALYTFAHYYCTVRYIGTFKRKPYTLLDTITACVRHSGTFKGEAPLASYNEQNALVVRTLLTQLLTRVYTYLSIQDTCSY